MTIVMNITAGAFREFEELMHTQCQLVRYNGEGKAGNTYYKMTLHAAAEEILMVFYKLGKAGIKVSWFESI